MYIENINNTNYIKVNDTATRIQLKISDNLSNPFDLKSAMQVVVVIGNRNGRILSKIPNLLDDTGVLEFSLDEGDLLDVGGNLSEVGDNLIEVHIIMPNGEKFVAPSSGHYKLRVTRSIDTLGEEVTTVTLDYFLEEANRVLDEMNTKVEYVSQTAEDLRQEVGENLDSLVTQEVANKMTPFVDEVSAHLAQKANKNEVRKDTMTNPIMLSELHTEVKTAMTGGTVAVVGEDAVGTENVKEKAITPKHLSFLESPKNLFSGDYVRGFLSQVNGSYRSDPDGGSVAVVEIEPNKTYSVKLHDETVDKRFVLSTTDTKPEFKNSYTWAKMLVSDNNLTEYTFTNDETGRYLLAYVSRLYDKPRLMIEEGETFSEYDNGIYQIPSEYNWELKQAVADIKSTTTAKSFINKAEIISPAGAINFDTTSGKVTFGEGVELLLYKNSKEKPDKIIVPPQEINDIKSWFFKNKYIIYFRLSTNEIKITRTELFNMTDEDIFLGTLRYKGTNDQLEVTGFENYYVDGKNPTEKTIEDLIEQPFYLLDDLRGTYSKPDNLSGMSTTDTISLVDSSHTIIYDIYDSLVSAYPDYVTRETLGTDSGGLPIYQYSFDPKTPDNYTSFDFKKIKIAVTSAIHGYEQLSAWATAKFFEDLCNNHESKEQLEFMRWNVHFVVIPVCNPSGYDANTRKNYNGVDINRNFPVNWVERDPSNNYYGGPSPGSEPETQIIMQFLQNHSDAVYHLDHHNIADGYPLVYSGSKNETQMALNVFRTLTRKWRKTYPEAPESEMLGIVRSSSGQGTITAYSRTFMNATTVESAWKMPFATAKYDKVTVESAVDLFGNVVVAVLKSLK